MGNKMNDSSNNNNIIENRDIPAGKQHFCIRI